jgi:hypothetical protein
VPYGVRLSRGKELFQRNVELVLVADAEAARGTLADGEGASAIVSGRTLA